MQNIKMLNAGEQGLVIEFGQAIDEKINAKVAKLTKLINETKLEGIIEVVPTYRSLLVYFEPLILSRKTLIDKVNTMLSRQHFTFQEVVVLYCSIKETNTVIIILYSVKPTATRLIGLVLCIHRLHIEVTRSTLEVELSDQCLMVY